MAKANMQAMEALHAKLAEVLAEGLKPQIDPETGETLPPNAAILNVARQFLKDNKVEALVESNKPLQSLADLPVFDEDEFPNVKQIGKG